MKSLFLAALALPGVLSAAANVHVQYTVYTQATAGDAYGLDGAALTFDIYSFDGEYKAIPSESPDQPDWVGFDVHMVDLTISGSQTWDGEYSLTAPSGSLTFSAVVAPGESSSGFSPLYPVGPSESGPESFLFDSGSFFILPAIVGGAFSGTAVVGGEFDYWTFEDVEYQPILVPFIYFGSSPETIELYNIAMEPTPAVPEPSTYAAIAGLGVLGFVVLRRRK